MSGLTPHPTDPERDRGSAELAVATPLMLLLLMLVVHIALWAQADHVAQTIAQHGQASARAVEATEAEGHTRAEEVADQLRGEILQAIINTVDQLTPTYTM